MVMEKEMNGPGCPLPGKWYLRDISIRTAEQWQVRKTFEGGEYVTIFEDGRMSSVFGGRIVCHASYWYGEHSMLLNLDGSRFDKQSGRYLKVSEQYRVYFDEAGELFLYATEPNSEDVGGYERFRFVRGERDEN
jgi:hypothetical protein